MFIFAVSLSHAPIYSADQNPVTALKTLLPKAITKSNGHFSVPILLSFSARYDIVNQSLLETLSLAFRTPNTLVIFLSSLVAPI